MWIIPLYRRFLFSINTALLNDLKPLLFIVVEQFGSTPLLYCNIAKGLYMYNAYMGYSGGKEGAASGQG